MEEREKVNKVILPARAQSVLKVKTEDGCNVDFRIPKGCCLVEAVQQLCKQVGVDIEMKELE